MRVIIFVATIFSCSFVFAGDWDARISFYLDVYEKSAENPKPIVYPKLSERINNAFLANNKNHVKIESTSLSTELYYTENEVVIYQHNEGWNLVTKGDYVYEWKHGEPSGVKFKKNNKDLVDYILYLTDPSYIMTSLYNGYNTKPENYEIKNHDGKPYKELALKETLYGFEAIYINTESLWFHGFSETGVR